MSSAEIFRSVPFEVTRADENRDDDGLTMEGYAAVFSSRTEIDSWEGTFGETIRKGAFRKTIRERTPVLQFDHGHHPLVGSIPIGSIRELREDERGLFVSARITDNWLIQPVRDAIAEGSISGMSFRFSVMREVWRDRAGKIVRSEELSHLLWDAGDRGPLERELIELRVPELGPVVFPAYADTVVGVRSKELAATIRGDDELRREARRFLAVGGGVPASESLSDSEFRHEVATALLFPSVRAEDAPADEGHPSDSESPEDASLRSEEHPSEVTDAPPSDGHPSKSNTDSDRRRAQIREITALMRERLASIKKDDPNGT